MATLPLSRRTVYRLLALWRPLRVVVCRLCCAVVLAEGIEQHARVHVATGPNGDES